MKGFHYVKKTLCAEGVSVRILAEKHGTPLFVYSRGYLINNFRNLSSAMAEVNPLICYSVKANSNASVIKTFLREGAGVDVVSGGELYRALRAGVKPSKVVFAGVGKTRDEIEYAVRRGILFFTVESEEELVRISDCAGRMRKKARVAIRVNPDVDPGTHRYITTGKKESKFGLDIARAEKAYKMAARMKNVEIAGLHIHIGSQILSGRPFAKALKRVKNLCADLKKTHKSFKYIDIGGGIGIQYQPDQEPLTPAEFAALLVPVLKRMGLSVVMEPGRYLVGNAGILVCSVQYVKKNHFRRFVVVDAGMNDVVRPPLYDAYHEIVPVIDRNAKKVATDVVGPICETADFLALDRAMPVVREGDLLAVMSAGAYCSSMGSNYNSRLRPAEVMVNGKRSSLIRKRETFNDLIRNEM